MIVIGVDPGLRGGVAVVNGATARVWPMPLTPDGRDYDIMGLRAILHRLPDWPPAGAFVERLWPMPVARGGVKANWQRGNAMGIFRVLLWALGVKTEFVAPQAWQNEMLPLRGGDTKARSIARARELFPGVSLLPTERSRVPSDGMADALLIAEFGRRRLAGARAAEKRGEKVNRG